MRTNNKDFVEAFLKMAPSIRKETLSMINPDNLKGEIIEIPLESRTLEALYYPSSVENTSLLLVLHSGGYVMGDAKLIDAFCDRIRLNTDTAIISLNYRLAPENPYPCAVNDVNETLYYLKENANKFGCDANRIGVLGMSAGASLATVACYKHKDLRCQVLFYPVTDNTRDYASLPQLPGSLSIEIMDAFDYAYCKEEELALSEVSPNYASDEEINNMPKALIITGGQDNLNFEGKKYAQLLREHGVTVEQGEFEYSGHGFIDDYCGFDEEKKKNITDQQKREAEEAIKWSIRFLQKYL